MSRGMNTMPTARRGRTYYKQGPNDSRGLGGICSVVFVFALLAIPPALLIASEGSRHSRFVALSDALDSDIVELNRRHHNHPYHHGRRHQQHDGDASEEEPSLRDALLRPGKLVHGTSDRIDALSSDPKMSVSIPGALTLRRNAEYCQWQEIRSTRCERCTRRVNASDGSSKEEKYDCNCVKEYNYVKAWRSRRINSLMFDQPGAHHNPQRDPMPTRMFADEGAELTFREGDREDENDRDGAEDRTRRRRDDREEEGGIRAALDPDMLSAGVRGQPHRRVEFVPDGRAPPPSFLSRFLSFLGFPARNVRYEPMHMLRNAADAPAAVRDNFVYVGQGGFFFSPYESAMSSKLFNYFAQYLEGSLFDWQVGDLMPSCTAGDLRFYYSVQDPTTVSVLGLLREDANGLRIAPRTMKGIGSDTRAATVGLVHAGRSGARTMLLAEDSDSRNRAHVMRALLFLWSVPASRLAGVALGRELGESSFATQLGGAAGLVLTLLGAAWLAIWGETFGALETALAFFSGATFGYLAYRSAPRKGAGRWWRAVWCRIAKWANAPPEWRVEDSYDPVPAPADSKSGGCSSWARTKMS